MRRRGPDRLRRVLWAGPVALAVCYFAFWACAPVFTQPPPIPLAADHQDEFGLGGGTNFNVWNQSDFGCGGIFSDGCGGPELQAWYRHTWEQMELDVVFHGGNMNLVGGGLNVRGWVAQNDAARLGLSGGVGFLYASFGVPMAARVTPWMWVYTEPSTATGFFGIYRLPVGASFLTGPVMFNVEGGVISDTQLRPAPYAAGSLGLSF